MINVVVIKIKPGQSRNEIFVVKYQILKAQV